MTRKGKIARLPNNIREELNQRLENGEQGVRVIEWLNSLPEVRAILAQDFEGQPISEANFSQWRNGGFLDWQVRQEARAVIEEWPVECGMGGSGGADPSSPGFDATKCGLSGKVAESLTERLTAQYAAALQSLQANTADEPGKQVERLGKSLKDMARLRRHELAREQVEISREWVAIERERLELERARLSTQARGATRGRDDAEQERLSHLEKAEMVKQMVEDLRKGAAGQGERE